MQIPRTDLNTKFINGEVSIKDLIYFRRLSVLLDCLIREFNKDVHCCFLIKKELLDDFVLNELGINFFKVMKILTTPENGKYIDIQYYPIICQRNFYVIPTTILCESNIIQNTMRFLQNKARLDGHSEKDLISVKYEKIFKEKNIKYCFGFSYITSDRREGELDVIYQIDNEIFISENKNMLPPTCYHDAINVVKDYEKARQQKEIFFYYYKRRDPLLMNKLSQLTNRGIDFANARKVHFYLTFGNRFALCKNTKDFPVVYISEIIAMMLNSPITLRNGIEVVLEMKWRDHDELYAADMCNYLYSNRILIDSHLCSTNHNFLGFKIEDYEYCRIGIPRENSINRTSERLFGV